MRILFLPHRVPFPPNKGDKIRSFHILAYLTQRHEVLVASLVDDPQDLQYVPEVTRRSRGYLFERLGPARKIWAALLSWLGDRPITVTYFYSKRMQQRIDDLIERSGIQAVFCFSSPMAEYVFRSRHAGGGARRLGRVMDLIDVDSRKWEQYADQCPWWKAWIYRREARQLEAYEHSITVGFDHVLLVSEQERRCLSEKEEAGKFIAMSNGVDLSFFKPSGKCRASGSGPAIVFTGVMDYFPNVEGVRWFAERILPRVREAIPEARFVIVGARPTADVLRLARTPGVEVTGFVPDVRLYLEAANVCVAPLRIARGIQNKVLEAMAMSKAVVTTSQALEGIRAEPGEDILVAEGADAFASSVIALLQDEHEAERLGRNARLCVEANYSWEANLAVLDEIFPASPAA